MEPFKKVTGKVAVLDRVNVDTDQIIPKQFLKSIERTGFGQHLFYDWRLNADGSPNADFELNNPAYQDASILVTGRNFGSGSSREHAVWALKEYGFRAIVSSSLADIFHRNCFENDVCPVVLSEEQVAQIMSNAKTASGYQMTVDLDECVLSDDQGLEIPFVIHSDPATHSFRRHCLLNGLDEIGLTLQHEDKILAYERGKGIS